MDSLIGKFCLAFLIGAAIGFLTTYDFNIALANIELFKTALNS